MHIRLVVAEDSYLIREGIIALLATQRDLELVAAVGTLPALLAAVEQDEPDVVLTDIRMPPTGTDEGIVAAERFATERAEMGVVVLSQYVEPEFALRLFTPSSRGRAYLLKERVGDLQHLHDAIARVSTGGSVLDPLVVDALVEARRTRTSVLERLTPRELEVLGLVAQGRSNAAIADELSLSEGSVEKNLTSILSKLDLPAEDSTVHRRVRAVLTYLSATSD